jgi:NTE family protein
MKQALINRLYRKVSKECTDGGLFDIVAGTSIGAINSSVLVGHYLKNNSWEGSAEKLLEFWNGLMCPTTADDLFHKNSLVRTSWEILPSLHEGLQICINLFHIWVQNSSIHLRISCLGGGMIIHH